MTEDTPNPGSPEAKDQGCTCPVLDNGRGEGCYKGGFIVRADCPLHDYSDAVRDNDPEEESE